MVPVATGDDAADEEVLRRRLRSLVRVGDTRSYSGTMDVVWSDSGWRDLVELRIDVPDDGGEPAVIILSGIALDIEAHLSDGKLCLWLPTESRWDSDDPKALDALLDEVERHLRRAIIRESDPALRWPGPAYGHGVQGWIEYLEGHGVPHGLARLAVHLVLDPSVGARHGRRKRCFCGSGRRFAKCHLPDARRHAATIEDVVRTQPAAQRMEWLRQLEVASTISSRAR